MGIHTIAHGGAFLPVALSLCVEENGRYLGSDGPQAVSIFNTQQQSDADAVRQGRLNVADVPDADRLGVHAIEARISHPESVDEALENRGAALRLIE